MLLLILFPQNGRSPTLRTYNSGAKLQIKNERTKKKGEKLASCSLDIVKILQLIIHHLVYSKNITNFAEMYKDEFIKEWHRRFD